MLQFTPPTLGLESINRDFSSHAWSFRLGSVAEGEQIAERIDAGQVWIDQHNALEVELPFGGVKSSGFGREGGNAGIEDFLETPVIGIRN